MSCAKLQSVVEFEDGRTDAFFADRSILSLVGSYLIYISSSGLRTQTHVGSIDLTAKQLAGKLGQLVEIVNTYSDTPLLVPKLWEQVEFTTKLKRVREFAWPMYEHKMVTETKEGWRLSSLDGSATIELQRDLLTVKVEYLQDLNQKEIQENGQVQYSSHALLQKYRVPFDQYVEDGARSAVAYRYMRMNKIFSLSAIPKRWKYPCGVLWRYVFQAGELQHPVIMPPILQQPISTKMPEPRRLFSENQIAGSTIPIFRYPNHTSRPLWLATEVGQTLGVVWFNENGPLGFDGKAYWLQESDTFHLKLFNTVESEKIYHIKGIPQIVRCGSYSCPVQEFLSVMHAYNKHYRQHQGSVIAQEHQPKRGFEEVHTITNEHAKLTAFANRILKARFHDGTIMTFDLNKNVARLITRMGQQLVVSPSDLEYKWYLEVVLRYAQEIFQPEKKLWRESMSRELDERLQNNFASMSILEGRPVTGLAESAITTSTGATPFELPSIEEALARNSRLMTQLSKLT